MQILIIEDELEIAEGISMILESEGYQATIALDGKIGFDEIMS